MAASAPRRRAIRRDPARLARLVLALGVIAAAALAAVAFGVLREPGEGARAAFLQLTAELGAAVQGEWSRFREELDAALLPVGELPPAREAAELHPGDLVERTAFDALVGEARRRELVLDAPAEALELLREALARHPDAGPGRRAEALLRAAVLAARLRSAEVAGALAEQAFVELEGHETRRGHAYLLLVARALAPALAPSARHALVEQVLARRAAGRLALPARDAEREASGRLRWPARGAAAALEALFDELVALAAEVAPEAPAEAPGEAAADDLRARLDDLRLRDEARALVDAWGPLPAPPAPDTLALHGDGERLLVLRADAQGAPHAALFHAPTVAATFARAATTNLALPAGFTVDTGRDAAPGTQVVRGRAELEGGLGFRLLHRDPEAAMAAGSRRLALTRGGLVLGAALCLGAAWITARALRREARLAELRRAFVAGVSHELRTPVASILLLTDNLRSGVVATPEAVERYHALLGREARRLSRLVHDVLDMSRLERGEPARVQLESVDLADFRATLEGELAERAAARGVELRCAGEAAGAARLDTEGLRRAILNLVENAMRHGEPPVLLTWTADAEGWDVTVRDHGAGPPSAARARLFEPFEHAGASGGTGLGLAIVAALAEAHGGSVEHREPESGRGACFVLRVPRDPEASAAPAASGAEALR